MSLRQIHNSHIEEKRALRLDLPPEGKIWLPFCGFGECAADYPDARVIGCDIDTDAVAYWQRERPTAQIRTCKAERFDFPDTPFSMADLDPFSEPWTALHHFLRHAPRTEEVLVVVTDGHIYRQLQMATPFDFSELRSARSKASLQAREQVMSWPDAAVRWLTQDLGCQVDVEDVRVFRPNIAYGRLRLSGGPRPIERARALPQHRPATGVERLLADPTPAEIEALLR